MTVTPPRLHSCTKSITSALIGIAIDIGYIQSVNQSVMDFFPERAGSTDQRTLLPAFRDYSTRNENERAGICGEIFEGARTIESIFQSLSID